MSPGPVPSVLRPYVSTMVAYDVRGEPGTHLGLPTTGLTFVIPLDDPLDVAWDDAHGERRLLRSCVSGLHTTAALIRHGSTQRGVQLELTPAGCRALLGLPAGAIATQLLDLEEVTPALAPLVEQVHDPGAGDPVRLVTDALVARLGRLRAPGPRPEVQHAMEALRAGARVDAVAARTGYSRRHLGALFRAECGVTPAQYRRLARFEASRAAVLGAARSGRLAAAAASSGYADQAHLTREWRALAGVTPTEWVRREFPFVQDTVAAGP